MTVETRFHTAGSGFNPRDRSDRDDLVDGLAEEQTGVSTHDANADSDRDEPTSRDHLTAFTTFTFQPARS